MTTTTTDKQATTQQSASRRPSSPKTTDTTSTPKAATPAQPTPEMTIVELEEMLDKIQTESAGLKDTDPKAARNAALAVALMRRVDAIKQKQDDEDPARRKATAMELAKVKERVEDLFGEHSSRIIDLELLGDEHAGRLDEHDVEISNTKRRVTAIEAMAKIPAGAVVAAVVISIIIWIIASLIWGSIDHSPAPVVLTDGTKIHQTSPLNDAFFVFAFGFIPAAIFFALFLLIARKRVKEDRSVATTQSVPPVKETTVVETAPTKVLETSPGANRARS